MLSDLLQNINHTFVLTSKPVNMLGGILFVVSLLFNTLFLVLFEV